jgi:hypothetical protein
VRTPGDLQRALATAVETAEVSRLPVVVDVVTERTAMAPLAYIDER